MADMLLVPMAVDALPVTEAALESDFRLQQPMADFSALPTGTEIGSERRPFDGSQIGRLAPPFGGEVPPATGIHLHWAVPRAFLHASKSSAEKSWQTIPAPDRWLVTRLALSAKGGEVYRSHFVVESDRLLKRATSASGLVHPTVPIDEPMASGGPRPGFRYIGARYDLAEWAEGEGERLQPFTALGHGSITFASYYPNSSTVFGFHDSAAALSDAAGGEPAVRLLYQITGWYAKADSLADAATRKALAEFWRIDAATHYSGCLIHGRTPRIVWSPKGPFVQRARPPIDFALSDHGEDALAAQLAHWTGIPELESFCAGLMHGLDQAGGDTVDALAQFRRARQNSGFAKLDGGREWRISPSESEKGKLDSLPPLPDHFDPVLRELNTRERELTADEGRLAVLRRDLFVDWCRYQSVLYGDTMIPFDPAWTETARSIVLEAAGIASALAKVIAGSRRSADDLAATLAAQIPKDYRLEPASLPSFQLPLNPVLVMLGEGARPFDRDQGRRPPPPGEGKSPDLRLPCRKANQVLSSIVFRKSGAEALVLSIAAKAEAGLGRLPVALRARAGELIDEALLLDPVFAASAHGKVIAPDLPLAKAIAALATAGPWLVEPLSLEGVEVHLRGALPPLSFAGSGDDEPPAFMPLFGQYEVAYAADRPDHLAPDFLLANAVWSADGDLDLFPDNPRTEGEVVRYRGMGVLSGLSLAPLLDAARGVDQRVPGLNLAAAFAPLAGLQPMAMELSGLNQAMVSLDQRPQMRVYDPYASSPRADEAALVRGAIGLESVASPQERAHFSPLRAGTMALRKIRLLDVFGRVRDDYPDNVRYAARLRTLGFDGETKEAARLRPRLLHPARLDLGWLAVDGRASTNHPNSSPVFGWLLVNRMDNGIAVFNPDGGRVFALSLEGERVDILAPPGGGDEPDNDELKAFLAPFTGLGGSAALKTVLRAISKSLETVQPERSAESGNLALLVGRPLALVRARASFETHGPTPREQSWADYAYRTANDVRERTTGGVPELKLPLHFGDASEYNDGAVLIWAHDKRTGANYAAPTIPADLSGAARPLADTPFSLTIGVADEHRFSLLLDPRAPFYMRCGLLPPVELRLSEEHYAAAYGALDVVFRAGPILIPKTAESLPLPPPRAVRGAWQYWTPMAVPEELDFDSEDRLPGPRGLVLSDGWLRLDPAADTQPITPKDKDS